MVSITAGVALNSDWHRCGKGSRANALALGAGNRRCCPQGCGCAEAGNIGGRIYKESLPDPLRGRDTAAPHHQSLGGWVGISMRRIWEGKWSDHLDEAWLLIPFLSAMGQSMVKALGSLIQAGRRVHKWHSQRPPGARVQIADGGVDRVP
jgi:hypothetical protein